MVIATALVAVVLIAMVYLILLNQDFNRYKPQIAKMVHDATGRELTIAGNIGFKIGIRPTLVVEDVSFQNASWSATADLAQVKRMEVQIAILPLVIGEFDFAHLVLIEPVVIVEFDRAGTSNFSFSTASQEQTATEIPPPPLIFSDIRIEKGRFIYRDAQSDFTFTIRIDRLTGEIPGFDKSLQLEFEGAFDDIPFTLDGTVGPIWAWVESGYELPADFTITAGGATAYVKGEMRDPTHFKDLAFTVTADGASTAGIARLAGTTGIPELGAFKLTARVTDSETDVFSIDKLGIALGATEFTGRVKLNMAEQVPFLTAELSSQKFEFGPASLNLHITDPIKKPAVKKIDLKFGTDEVAEVRLNGIIANLIKLQGVDISFLANGKDLANLEKWIGRPLPVRGAFSAAGKVITPALKNFRIPDLKIAAGKNNITGALNLDLSGDKPQLRAELASPQLDLPSVLLPKLAKEGWARGLEQVRPVKLEVTLESFDREMAVTKVDLQAGSLASAELRLTGSVQNLASQRGIDLDFFLQGNELNNLHAILAQPYLFAPLPGQGAYAISGKISDPTTNDFKISDLKFVLAGTELTGWVDFNLAAQPPQYEVDISAPKFNLKPFPIPKEAAYANLNQIDDLGPFKIHSKVIVKGDHLSLSQIELQAGSEHLTAVEVNGSIKNLTEQTGIDLNFSIQGSEVANLTKITGHPLPLKGAYGLSGKLSDPAKKNYRISDLKLKIGANNISGSMDLNLGGQQFQLATVLSAPKFTLKPVTIPELEPLSRIEDLGPLALTASLAGTSQKMALENLDLNIGSQRLIEVVLKGKINDLRATSGLDLDFSARGNELASFSELGGPALPFQGAFNVSGRLIDPASKIYKIPSLEAAWGDNDSRGWITLDLSKDRPHLSAEMSSQKLDLRPLFEKPDAKSPAGAPAAKADSSKRKIFPSKPFELEKLKAFDADIKLRDKQILLPALALDNVIIDILLDNGHLALAPFTFDAGGGKADVQFELRLQDTPPTLVLAKVIDQLDVGSMLEELGYSRSLEGMLDAKINLVGRGASPAELMAGLNGSIVITMVDGQATDKYLDLLEKYLGSDVLQLLNPFKARRESAPVNCFVSRIQIKDGLADVKLLLDTDQTSIFGVGDVNLGTEKLDLGIKPTPKKGAGISGVGSISFSLKELSQPFELGGTLAHPSLAVDPGRTAWMLGKLAGALALGPAGWAAFFADISVGKQDPCPPALEAAAKIGQPADEKEEDQTAKKTDSESEKEKKSGGFFQRLFGK
ncbi:MAG: AsmA family protein [Desulfobacteraceae bacterium]|nr:AsmA family protein [Desulfobacteraceae bacterium]